jgi:hypothetical protein
LIKTLGITPFAKILVMTSCGSINSNIVEPGEFNLLKEWSGEADLKLQLIYRANDDGWTQTDF